MPRKTYNTKADFDADYSVRIETSRPSYRPWIRVGYTRAAFYPLCQQRAEKLVSLFGWSTDTKILIVGAGYGWTAEALEADFGYSNVVCTDTSPHIQSTQDEDEEDEINAAISAVGLDPNTGEGLQKKLAVWTPGNRRRHSRQILNESLLSTASRNNIVNALGGIDVIISEEIVTLLDDNEAVFLCSQLDLMNQNAIHLTTELLAGHTQDPSFNWKTLSGWKSLVPSHTWVSLNTWEIL